MSDVLRTALEYCHFLELNVGTGGHDAGDMKMYTGGHGAICVALEDYDAGDSGIFITFGDRVRLPKVTGSGTAIEVGEFVYYDDTENAVCSRDYAASNPGTYYRCGVCTVAATIGATHVETDFYGDNHTVVTFT